MSKLLDYIDWSAISEDHNLKHGDITPYQTQMLEDLLQKFIFQNKESFDTATHSIELTYQDSKLIIHYNYHEGTPRTEDYIGDAPEVEIESIFISDGVYTCASNLYEWLEYNQPLMDFIESEILTKHED